MAEEIDVEKAAVRPKQVSQDGRTVQSHDPTQVIEADAYYKACRVSRSPISAIKSAKPRGNAAW